MEYLRVKNWSEFQHYKDRNPPWIKLHRVLLDNYEFCSLLDVQKAHLVMIWIHASQNDGIVPNDPEFLMQKLSIKKLDISALVAKGFLIPEQGDSAALAANKQNARLEEKRREEEKATLVLQYLNSKADREYRPVQANLKFIVARLAEGATVDDCKTVIDGRVRLWRDDLKMSQYLRPETLFNATKFAQYIGVSAGKAEPTWE